MWKQAENTKDFGVLTLEPILDIKIESRVFPMRFLIGYTWEKKTLLQKKCVCFYIYLYNFTSIFISLFLILYVFITIFININIFLSNFIITVCFNKLDHSFCGCFQFTHKKQLNIHILNFSLVSVLALKWNSCKKYVNYEVSTLDQAHNGQIRQCRKLGQVYYSLIWQKMLEFKKTHSLLKPRIRVLLFHLVSDTIFSQFAKQVSFSLQSIAVHC